MEKFECQKCGYEMLTNSFICKHCEYMINRQNDSHHTELVRNQFVAKEMIDIPKSHISAYWDYSNSSNPKNDDGDVIEDMRANSDQVSELPAKRRIGSKCIFCESKVLISQEGIDTHAHDSCWAVFKGQMLKEDN